MKQILKMLIEKSEVLIPDRYAIAHASGHDVANRSMREAGRTKWSKADYNKAVKEFNRLFPKEEA